MIFNVLASKSPHPFPTSPIILIYELTPRYRIIIHLPIFPLLVSVFVIISRGQKHFIHSLPDLFKTLMKHIQHPQESYKRATSITASLKKKPQKKPKKKTRCRYTARVAHREMVRVFGSASQRRYTACAPPAGLLIHTALGPVKLILSLSYVVHQGKVYNKIFSLLYSSPARFYF